MPLKTEDEDEEHEDEDEEHEDEDEETEEESETPKKRKKVVKQKVRDLVKARYEDLAIPEDMEVSATLL